MKLYELIGEGHDTFTIEGRAGINKIERVITVNDIAFGLDDEVVLYLTPEQEEIQRLLSIIEKRDKEIAKHKQPRTYTSLNIGHRNDVLDFNHFNPNVNGQATAKACSVTPTFVSKVLRGTHPLCKQAPMWEAPNAETQNN